MKLTFAQRHLSIAAFPEIELPPLAIIVGINGSGKTHLLQAIDNGSVANSIAPRAPNNMAGMTGSADIKLLNASIPALQFTEYNSPAAQALAGPQAIPGRGMRHRYEDARRQALSLFDPMLDQATGGALSRSLRAGEDPWRLGVDGVVGRTGADASRISEIFAAATEKLLEAPVPGAQPYQQNPVAQQFPYVRKVAAKAGVTPLQVTEDHIRH